MERGTRVRAIHRDGVLRLLTPLDLPEGAQVSVIVLETPIDEPTKVMPWRWPTPPGWCRRRSSTI
jgi:hypothetical protein